jgi:hypothetical protein
MRWLQLYEEQWGPLTVLNKRASKIAGGWECLYKSKREMEMKSAPWKQPSPHEVTAAMEALTDGKRTTPRKEMAVVFLVDGSGSMHEGANASVRWLC